MIKVLVLVLSSFFVPHWNYVEISRAAIGWQSINVSLQQLQVGSMATYDKAVGYSRHETQMLPSEFLEITQTNLLNWKLMGIGRACRDIWQKRCLSGCCFVKGCFFGKNFALNFVPFSCAAKTGSCNPDIQSRRLTRVLYTNGDPDVALFVKPEFSTHDCKVSPNLLFTDFSGVFSHFLGGQQSSPDIVDTEGRNDSHQRRYNKHPKGPPGHVLLGLQVAFGALILIGGLYYINHAFRKGASLSVSTGTLYLLLGMAGVGVGIGFILTALFST